MLKYLRIQNFAIIENVEIEFGGGLNILSGETGAGKSIIMDALNLILGGRASSEIIRAGCTTATVEALFEAPETIDIKEILENSGIDLEDNELIVRRIVQDNGKNRVFINNTMVNINVLNSITERLVDLCSQGDQRMLSNPEEQLFWLDRYANLETTKEFLKEKYTQWKQKYNELHQLEVNSIERTNRIEFLKFQLKELEAAQLQNNNEDEEIKNELNILSNSETLYAFAKEAEAAIYGSDEDTKSMMDILGNLVNRAQVLVKTDKNLAPAYELMNSLKLILEEAGFFFRDYTQKISVDEGRLEELNLRMNTLNQLKRKYGPSLLEVISIKNKFQTELSLFENHEEAMEFARMAEAESREIYINEATQLSQQRKSSAKNFDSDIERELAELNMERAKFITHFAENTEPSLTGIDNVQFLISANPGEPPQSLSKVASGGELSRIMLALHNVLSAKGGVRVYLFDEVDTGISGRTAAIVGAKLKRVSKNSQVICITHLPQVASYADRHIRVEKAIVNLNNTERTVCSVLQLEGENRVQELARMLGGFDNQPEAIANAEALLHSAQQSMN